MLQQWQQLPQLVLRRRMLLLRSCMHLSVRGVSNVREQHQGRHLTLQVQPQKHAREGGAQGSSSWLAWTAGIRPATLCLMTVRLTVTQEVLLLLRQQQQLQQEDLLLLLLGPEMLAAAAAAERVVQQQQLEVQAQVLLVLLLLVVVGVHG
jgi:hypothetical protein